MASSFPLHALMRPQPRALIHDLRPMWLDHIERNKLSPCLSLLRIHPLAGACEVAHTVGQVAEQVGQLQRLAAKALESADDLCEL